MTRARALPKSCSPLCAYTQAKVKHSANVCPEHANTVLKSRILWHQPFSGNIKVPLGFDFAVLIFVELCSASPGGFASVCYSSRVICTRQATCNGSVKIYSWSSP